MTILSSVGTFSRLTPPIPPDPGFLDSGGSFFLENLTFVANRALPNNAVPEGIFVSTDGLKFFVIDSAGIIYQYDASSAFDVATLTYNSVNINLSSFTGTSAANRDLFFDPSGTRLYIISDATDNVAQFSLSTPWDISSATYTNKKFVINNPNESNHKAISISSDGSKFFLLGSNTDSVYEFSMTTVWDISTAVSQNRSFSISAYETSPEGMTVSPDGRSFLIIGTTSDIVAEFELASSWNLTLVTFKKRQFSVVSLQPVLRGIYYHADGYLYMVSQTNNSISSFHLGTLQFGVTPLSIINKGYKVVEDLGQRVSCIRFDIYGVKMLLMKGETIYEYNTSYGATFDITALVSSGYTFAADPQNQTLAQNIFFDNSGLKYYVVGYNNSNISQYNLNNNFDLTVRTYVANKAFTSGTGGLNMGTGGAGMGIFITPDGKKLFVALSNSTYGVGIYRADFSTAWDVTTLSTDLTKTNYKFLNSTWGLSTSLIVEFSFSRDGRKLYLYEKTQKRIYQFGLASPYSIGSAVIDNYYSTDYLDSSGFSYANFFTGNTLNPGNDIVLFYGNSRYFLTQFDV